MSKSEKNQIYAYCDGCGTVWKYDIKVCPGCGHHTNRVSEDVYENAKKNSKKEILIVDDRTNRERELACFLINWKRKDGSYETDSCFGYCEVVGNVIDNPELLEVG